MIGCRIRRVVEVCRHHLRSDRFQRSKYRRPLSAGGFLVLIAAVLVLTEAWYTGGDTNSTPPSQPGTREQFYAGELGYNNTGACHTTDFKITSAKDVNNNNGTYDNVFTYWYLEGPDPFGFTGTQAYELGENQAIDLFNCWKDTHGQAPKALYSDGLTLFADAEKGQGWYSGPFNCHCESTAHWQANVNVISGFAAEAASLMGAGNHQVAGIYEALSVLSTFQPGQSWPSDYFIWYAAGGCTAAGGQPVSLQSLTWYESAMVKWHTLNKKGSCLGGAQGVSLWQYHITPDYDLTPQQGVTGCFKGSTGADRCGGAFDYGWGDGTI
jgi:hypothetical protein